MTLTLDITAYTTQHGHPPLLIGRQYTWRSFGFFGFDKVQTVTLTLAGVGGAQVTVANRWGGEFRVSKSELEWME